MKLTDIINSSRSLVRTGWMLRGVPASAAESVASHSFAAALIALELAQRLGLDPYRSAATALVHDIAEARIGDIAKVAGIDEAKRSAEDAALEDLEVSELIKDLVREYNGARTDEALVARAADLAATLVVSKYYMKLGFEVGEIEESSVRGLRSLAESWGLGDKLLQALRELGILK
ncbi:MAG: HD domain-containing protein [Acidilobus sp.]